MDELIFGRKPVYEAIRSGKEIEKVMIAYGSKGEIIQLIKHEARKAGIKVSETPPAKLDQLVKNKNSQGVAAWFSPVEYLELEEMVESLKDVSNPLLLILDSIQDPHNVGAIMRTAECAGVDGVILTQHNSAQITGTVEKTSAGALSYVKIAKANNLVQAIKQLKDCGYWIVGTKLGGEDYTAVDYKMPVALIMGNEEKGIRRLVSENCDFLVEIPMRGKIQSLNVSVSTGVLLFEILRQRRKPQ